VILDLCAGTKAWSKPYAEAGYDVRIVTLPETDVHDFARSLETAPLKAHGVLAAPPCTEFAVSGARWWAKKDDRLLFEAISVVKACLRIIERTRPEWWAIENPVGRIQKCVPELGRPLLVFDPSDYGDGYTKRTLLWGRFKPPAFTARRGDAPMGSKMHRVPPGPKRQEIRSATPPGFARAFFEANP